MNPSRAAEAASLNRSELDVLMDGRVELRQKVRVGIALLRNLNRGDAEKECAQQLLESLVPACTDKLRSRVLAAILRYGDRRLQPPRPPVDINDDSADMHAMLLEHYDLRIALRWFERHKND